MGTRSIEDRISEKEAQLQKMMKKTKMFEEQLKKLQAQKSESDRKARAHRLIEIGASVEAALGRIIEKGELPLLIEYIKIQEEKGNYITRALENKKEYECTGDYFTLD